MAVPCGVVTFDYLAWSSRYPELAAWVGAPQAQAYFDEAALYCDNTPCSPIPIWTRPMILGMATAHIAALNAPLNNAPSSPLVGRISNATEGSVTVATQNDYPPGVAQWWQQTKYGAAWWAATVQYRTMHYSPPPPVSNGGVPFGNFPWVLPWLR